MIVDPPYNLTKNFGKSTFKERENSAYQQWFDEWLSKTVRLLKDNASIYICADWKLPLPFPKLPVNIFCCKTAFPGSGRRGAALPTTGKLFGRHLVFYQKQRLHFQSGGG
ncbi:MAG: DNA methyltransferase [Oscillospiraceae bacterium]